MILMGLKRAAGTKLAFMTAGKRWLQVLQPYTAPLSFDVPPPTEQRNTIDRLAAKQIAQRIEKKKTKDDKRAAKAGHTSAEYRGVNTDTSSLSSRASTSTDSSTHDDDTPRPSSSRIRRINEKADDKLLRKPHKAAQIEAKRERKLAKQEKKSGRREQKEERKEAKGARKQEEKAQSMEFVVVEALNAA
jgi:hypothetical protein